MTQNTHQSFQTSAPNDRLVSLSDTAARLGLSTRAVYRLIARDDLPPPVKVGGASRFFRSDIDAYLNRLKSARNSR